MQGRWRCGSYSDTLGFTSCSTGSEEGPTMCTWIQPDSCLWCNNAHPRVINFSSACKTVLNAPEWATVTQSLNSKHYVIHMITAFLPDQHAWAWLCLVYQARPSFNLQSGLMRDGLRLCWTIQALQCYIHTDKFVICTLPSFSGGSHDTLTLVELTRDSSTMRGPLGVPKCQKETIL